MSQTSFSRIGFMASSVDEAQQAKARLQARYGTHDLGNCDVIVALGGNDVLRGIDPTVARVNLDQILRTAVDADVDVLLIGIEVPANYGPEYKTAFDAIYADLADEYGALLVENFLGAILTPDPSDMRVWLQEDGLHPNAEGVSRIVAAIGPSVLDLVQRADG